MRNCKIDKKKRKVLTLPGLDRAKTFGPAEGRRLARRAALEAARCLATEGCDACDVCSLLCPDLCITRDAATGRVVIDYDYCKGCGICGFVCPKGAISMDENIDH